MTKTFRDSTLEGAKRAALDWLDGILAGQWHSISVFREAGGTFRVDVEVAK